MSLISSKDSISCQRPSSQQRQHPTTRLVLQITRLTYCSRDLKLWKIFQTSRYKFRSQARSYEIFSQSNYQRLLACACRHQSGIWMYFFVKYISYVEMNIFFVHMHNGSHRSEYFTLFTKIFQVRRHVTIRS